jgi:ribonuclease P protein component
MKQFGLSRKERVVNNKEFDLIYKEGTIRKSGNVMVRYLPNNLGYSRLGIAVSKKIFRASVRRNRVKRLIREAFRLNKTRLPKGLNIIVSARMTPGNRETQVTLSEIQTELLKIFKDYSC